MAARNATLTTAQQPSEVAMIHEGVSEQEA